MLKRIASCLGQKWKYLYSCTCRYVKIIVTISLVKSINRCIRGGLFSGVLNHCDPFPVGIRLGPPPLTVLQIFFPILFSLPPPFFPPHLWREETSAQAARDLAWDLPPFQQEHVPVPMGVRGDLTHPPTYWYPHSLKLT